jgi:uncharacterized membrane protein YebE (DUF533 family)
MPSDEMKMLRAWAAAAWADGKLHPNEKRALERFIQAAKGLTDHERATAGEVLEKPQQIDAAELRSLGKDAREGVYRAARSILGLDLVIPPEELEWLAKLREVLELDAATMDRIEHPKK